MIRYLLRFLGVSPDVPGKTGKRETAWAMVLIALILTSWSMWLGETMVSAMTAILLGLWAFATTILGGAYKLEHDKGIWRQDRNVLGESTPPGYPPDVVAPENYNPETDSEP